jgi:hypothetical protein
MMANRFPFGPARRSGGDAERPVDVFVRGLLSGAVVGAVIAGSAVWERRRRRQAAASEARSEPGAVAEPEAVAERDAVPEPSAVEGRAAGPPAA